MNEQKIDELIAKALREEAQLPEGLGERLEQHIDRMARPKKDEARRVSLFRRWKGFSIAASVLLVIGMGIGVYFSESQPKDTFDDPKEAAWVAEQALLVMSQNLNKGFDGIHQAGEEITKVNQVINKQIQ